MAAFPRSGRATAPAPSARRNAASFPKAARASSWPCRKSGLANVTAPTLVIHGADDPLVPLPAGEATARAIPGARLLVIERMGHALPQAVWPQILDAIVAHAKAATPQDASAPAPAAIEAPATGLGRLAALAMRMLRGHKG